MKTLERESRKALPDGSPLNEAPAKRPEDEDEDDFDDWLSTLEESAEETEYAANRYRKDNVSLGMVDVELDEEWTYEKEVYGRDPFKVDRLNFVHVEGLAKARLNSVDLSECYVCGVEVTRPIFSPDSVNLFARKYPAVHMLHGNPFYVLGFGGYRRNHGTGCIDLQIFLVDDHLTEATYSHTGIIKPPITFRHASYPLKTRKTPDWIVNHGRSRRPHSELDRHEEESSQRDVGAPNGERSRVADLPDHL